MNTREEVLNLLMLALSVGLIVPLWGTFHSLIGIRAAWPAFASAALYFAAGHKLKDSPAVAAGHVIGVGWGMAMFVLLGKPEFQQYGPIATSLAVLCALGIAAVIATNLKISLISHLPALFCGWAVAVGALAGIPAGQWGNLPVDIILSLVAGVFIVGVGISQLHELLAGTIKVKEHAEVQPDSQDHQNEEENVSEKISLTESKIVKFTTPYQSDKAIGPIKEAEKISRDDLSELKGEIVSLKMSLKSSQSSASSARGDYAGMPVHIVGICGSPHKKGSTVVYVKKALEAAESLGNVTTGLIELAGKDIKPCMGCKSDKCHGTCRINDAMQDIYPVLRECDGIVIGSPSYFGTFTGQLKVFIDRLRVMRHTDFQLGNKVVAPLSVAGRRHGGQEITNLDLVQAMMRHNTIVVNDGTVVCQLGATGWSHTFDDPGSTVDDDAYGLQTAEGVGKRVAEIAKVIKASGLQKTVYKYNAQVGKR